MEKFFNTAGPCVPDDHYMIPSESRCGDLLSLVREKRYFVIHAPRQVGKTTLIREFVQRLNQDGQYLAVYCSLEEAQGIEDAQEGIPVVVQAVQDALAHTQIPFPHPGERHYGSALRAGLNQYCSASLKPLVIMFDEVDCLSDATMVSFLRQLRKGYVERSTHPFVTALALVGMRNIRDYKGMVRQGQDTLGSASPFNIVSEALTIRNFNIRELGHLLGQHGQATGQTFSDEVIAEIFRYSNGQPWLCNAIAREVIVKLLDRDTARHITSSLVEKAVENIILRRDTHIDSLLERLKEARVRRIMEPVILGHQVDVEFSSDDASYVFDLGLLVKNKGDVTPANPIYREVIIRALTYETQYQLPTSLAGRFIKNGKLDMMGLLMEFQQFWRENSDIWVEKYTYKEAAPHLILQAFLQRVINGGGRIDREYSAGRGRTDLCIGLNGHRYPLELKINHRVDAREKGIEQLAGYMEILGLTEGWLMLFDRDPGKSWDRKISWEEVNHGSVKIHVVGC